MCMLPDIDMDLFYIQLPIDKYWICEMCVCVCVWIYVSQHMFQYLVHTCHFSDTTFIIL